MKLALLFVEVAAMLGCSHSDKTRAMEALSGQEVPPCLSEAHWKSATRTGVFQEIGPGEGAYFMATDKPLNMAQMNSYFFGAYVAGNAGVSLNNIARLESQYLKAGSPTAPIPKNVKGINVSEHLLVIGEVSWSLRGVASGWLSQEDDISCGSDTHNGRYFIITEFKPGFPVNGN